MVCPRRRLCTSRYPGKRRGKRSCTLASSLDCMWAVSLPNRPGKMKITLLSNKDTVVLRIIRNYLSWDVPANFFRHSGRLLCTDWNLDLSALIRCHLFLKDFQQLMAPAPLMVSLTVRIPLFINRILQLEMYCPAPGCQSDCQQTFLHLWLVTGRQTFLATFFWMSRQTCAESFVNFFLDRDFGFNLSLNLK